MGGIRPSYTADLTNPVAWRAEPPAVAWWKPVNPLVCELCAQQLTGAERVVLNQGLEVRELPSQDVRDYEATSSTGTHLITSLGLETEGLVAG